MVQNTGEGGLQYGTQQSMEVVADMQGAVDVDSDAMGSAWVCHMYTTINHGVRIQQSTVGYIQHQPWVSIIDVLIPNQQRTCGYFMGRVVEYRPDTTTTHTNRTSFDFEGEHACNRGERFQQSKYVGVICMGGVR